jgi:hypothetical protein
VWISWLGWDNFPAVPCSAVSPLEAFAHQLTATPAAGIYIYGLSASAGTHSPERVQRLDRRGFENVGQRTRVRRGWVRLLANFQNNMHFFLIPDNSEKTKKQTNHIYNNYLLYYAIFF